MSRSFVLACMAFVVVNNLDTSEEALPVFSMAATGVFKRVRQ
jgi:hypothetical protein